MTQLEYIIATFIGSSAAYLSDPKALALCFIISLVVCALPLKFNFFTRALVLFVLGLGSSLLFYSYSVLAYNETMGWSLTFTDLVINWSKGNSVFAVIASALISLIKKYQR